MSRALLRVGARPWLGVLAGEHLIEPVECHALPYRRTEAAAVATGSLSLRESVEALLARQEIEELLALRGEVALPFGDEGRATNEAGLCFDGIAGQHAEKLTEGLRPERRHTGAI